VGSPVSFNNKTDCHDITEILLKVALSTIKPNQSTLIEWGVFIIMHRYNKLSSKALALVRYLETITFEVSLLVYRPRAIMLVRLVVR
jgi:hypothetical protein